MSGRLTARWHLYHLNLLKSQPARPSDWYLTFLLEGRSTDAELTSMTPETPYIQDTGGLTARGRSLVIIPSSDGSVTISRARGARGASLEGPEQARRLARLRLLRQIQRTLLRRAHLDHPQPLQQVGILVGSWAIKSGGCDPGTLEFSATSLRFEAD